MLYVLTAIENKDERPVAVVDSEQTANEWVKEDKGHNWIPFDLNDVQGLGQYTQFRSAPGSPAEQEAKKREGDTQQLQKMEQLVADLTKANKQLMQALRKRGIKVPQAQVTSAQLLTPAHKWSTGNEDVD